MLPSLLFPPFSKTNGGVRMRSKCLWMRKKKKKKNNNNNNKKKKG